MSSISGSSAADAQVVKQLLTSVGLCELVPEYQQVHRHSSFSFVRFAYNVLNSYRMLSLEWQVRAQPTFTLSSRPYLMVV